MRPLVVTLITLTIVPWTGCGGGGGSLNNPPPPTTPPVVEGPLFVEGDTIPGFVMQKPDGSRADVSAISAFSPTTGTRSVTFERSLTTADAANDVQFAPGESFFFNVAIFDAEDGWDLAPGMTANAGSDYSVAIPSNPGPVGLPFGFPPKLSSLDGELTADGKLRLTFVWDDSTDDSHYQEWFFDGVDWKRDETQADDMIAVIWCMDPDESLDVTTGNCDVMCHAGIGMWAEQGKVDLWQWSATRTAAYDRSDDGSIDDSLGSGFAIDDGKAASADNSAQQGTVPASMAETDPGARAKFLIVGKQGAHPAVPYDPNADWVAGDEVPATVLRKWPEGGVADVGAIGVHVNGGWTVTLERDLTTDDPVNDVQFIPGSTYFFQFAIFDGEDGSDLGEGMTLDSHLVNYVTIPTSPGDAVVGLNQTKDGLVEFVKVKTNTQGKLIFEIDWHDTTVDDRRFPWVFSGASWSQDSSIKEDQVAVIWGIPSDTPLGNGPGTTMTGLCVDMCHVPTMYTAAGSQVDLWHWRASRNNPGGFADDRVLNDSVTGGFLSEPGTPVGYANEAGGNPALIAESDPGAGATFLFEWPPGSERSITFDDGASAPPPPPPPPGDGPPPDDGGGGGPGGPAVSFSAEVNPIFGASCSCHRNGGTAGGLNLDSYANLLLGGDNNAVFPTVVPGDGTNSLLYMKVSMDTPPIGSRMPLGGPPLSTALQQTIKDWLDQGALDN